MAKKSSYRRLKEKYEIERMELMTDIYDLINHKDGYRGLSVEFKWKLQWDLEAIVWGGEPTKFGSL